MIFILTQPNLANPDALEVRTLPKQIFGRSVSVLPKGWPFHRVFWRLFFEHALTRYLIALTPFPLIMLIWPGTALPISQAPLLMLIVIYIFETRVLSIPKDKREGLADEDTIGRALDQLRVRSVAALTELATRRGIEAGEMHLVVEQSEMARVPPLPMSRCSMTGPRGRCLCALMRQSSRRGSGVCSMKTLPRICCAP